MPRARRQLLPSCTAPTARSWPRPLAGNGEGIKGHNGRHRGCGAGSGSWMHFGEL